RVEVAEQPRPDVTHVRPFPGDAGGVGRERGRHPDRGANLPTMRGLQRRTGAGVGCAGARRVGIAARIPRATGVHRPTTGHAAAAAQPPVGSAASAQTLVLWVWSHPPCPLQPAVVHALPSVSAHGVLFDANMCVCTHTPRSALVALPSQPAVVHVLPSVSVHGVLASGGPSPLAVSQPLLPSSAPGQPFVL